MPHAARLRAHATPCFQGGDVKEVESQGNVMPRKLSARGVQRRDAAAATAGSVTAATIAAAAPYRGDGGGLAPTMRPGIDEWIEGTSESAPATTAAVTFPVAASVLMLPPRPFEPALENSGFAAQLGYVGQKQEPENDVKDEGDGV